MMLTAKLMSQCAAGWYKADLPFVGEYDLDNVGKFRLLFFPPKESYDSF